MACNWLVLSMAGLFSFLLLESRKTRDPLKTSKCGESSVMQYVKMCSSVVVVLVGIVVEERGKAVSCLCHNECVV